MLHLRLFTVMFYAIIEIYMILNLFIIISNLELLPQFSSWGNRGLLWVYNLPKFSLLICSEAKIRSQSLTPEPVFFPPPHTPCVSSTPSPLAATPSASNRGLNPWRLVNKCLWNWGLPWCKLLRYIKWTGLQRKWKTKQTHEQKGVTWDLNTTHCFPQHFQPKGGKTSKLILHKWEKELKAHIANWLERQLGKDLAPSERTFNFGIYPALN